MIMMMSSMLWFLLLPLFTFVDSEVVTCGVGDATPFRIVVEPCEDFYYNFEWEVRQRGLGQLTEQIEDGQFTRDITNGFENDELCLDPSECYFVRLSTEFGNGLYYGGNYTIYYNGTLTFSGGSFTSGPQFDNVDSIDFGNGCATSAPSMSSSVMPSSSSSPTTSMSPTAPPTITLTMAPTATPTMAPTATPTMAPTAKPAMTPTATPKANELTSTSSVGSFDYTAITITVVIASLAVLCVGGW